MPPHRAASLRARRLVATSGWLLAAACSDDVSTGSGSDTTTTTTTTAATTTGSSDGPGATGGSSSTGSADVTTHAGSTSTASESEGPPVLLDVGTSPDVGGGDLECSCGVTTSGTIWVANSAQGTVSKIDTETLVEVGRYLTAPGGTGDPSRTSVNFNGTAAAIANRNGGLAKIWAVTALCDPMANGQAGLQTSSGPDDVLDWQDDDCLAWFTPFDADSQRPVAWTAGCGADSRVWTSTCVQGQPPQAHLVYGDTGGIEASVDLVGFPCGGFNGDNFGAYGGAVDGEGNFWVSTFQANLAASSRLARIDRRTLAVTQWDVPQASYGITVDNAGRPWLSSNYGGLGTLAVRFDPVTELFDEIPGNAATDGQSGLAQDGLGRMWVASYSGSITAIDAKTLALGPTIQLPGALLLKGVSVDHEGRVWAVDYEGSQAFRVDPDGGDVDVVGGLDGPYTYSDMTGTALQNASCPPAG